MQEHGPTIYTYWQEHPNKQRAIISPNAQVRIQCMEKWLGESNDRSGVMTKYLYCHNFRRIAVPLAAVFLVQWAASAHDSPPTPKKDVDQQQEDYIHWPGGFDNPGQPPNEEASADAKVMVRIIDAATGKPTPCRVNLLGSDGNYYEPKDNPLARWSLHRTGNRRTKGPFRYYGWFFYTLGTVEANVPAGALRIEVAKGYEYRPVTKQIEVTKEKSTVVEIRLERSLDMAARGWYSGDTHIHLDRQNEKETSDALQLIEAEDIRFGFLLAMNDPKTYTGTMETQTWPQDMGMGRASARSHGIYTITSGQEYRNKAYGHILLLLNDRLVFPDESFDPNDWPLFDAVVRDTHDANGVALHAHGGYEQEIYADYVHGAGDAIEVLQFAVYRGVGLEGWYHMLNARYRLPMVGGSDYPYCRALGDGRTYVQGETGIDVEAWTQGLVQGKSFVTTGPMLLLQVNGNTPGSIMELSKDTEKLSIEIEVLSEVVANEYVELIVNGKVMERIHLKDSTLPQRVSLSREIECTQSMWIAARTYAMHPAGLPNSEAHTNPIYIQEDGKPIRHQESIDWLVKKLDGQIQEHEKREFKHKAEVLHYFKQAREKLLCDIPDTSGQ
jgi:hypothetical protein